MVAKRPVGEMQSSETSSNRMEHVHFNYTISVRTERTVARRRVSPARIAYLSCDCGRGSAPDPTGELTALPQIPSCIKEIRFTAEKKGRSGQGRREGEGRGGEKWRDRGMERKEREGVDFPPLLQ